MVEELGELQSMEEREVGLGVGCWFWIFTVGGRLDLHLIWVHIDRNEVIDHVLL